MKFYSENCSFLRFNFQVPLEDLKKSARELAEALMLRKEYMERIGNQFPLTTTNFLSGHYPNNLPRFRRKNIEIRSFRNIIAYIFSNIGHQCI